MASEHKLTKPATDYGLKKFEQWLQKRVRCVSCQNFVASDNNSNNMVLAGVNTFLLALHE